jgi:hypothetical protein
MGKIVDIANQKFGSLTALYKIDKKGADGSYFWHCICDCGNECDIYGISLRTGHTTSCGCKRKIATAQNGQKNVQDLSNKKFGLLTVIEKTNDRKNGSVVWKCKCDCGNICYIPARCLVTGNTKSCGCIKKSFGEQKIKELLEENNIIFEQEKRFKDCKDELPLPFDFYVNNEYIIEFDGIQHFEFKEDSGWNTEEHLKITQKHDKIKNEYCKNNNIPIIRIPYTHLNDLCLDDLQLGTSSFII